ncbi:ribosome small subunit-dependent GTPase A [Acidothermaceae bacterium B102]|nr:ribosome small subunit-dependent GTPase A [Acidothermaceae bacterium B102]
MVRVDRGLVTLDTPAGERRLPLTGKLRQSDTSIAVGDWVVLDQDAVAAILPRSTSLLRRDTDGSATSQAIAANVDLVIVAVPLTESVRVRKLERYLVFARSSGADVVVVLTKADLWADVDGAVADAVAVSGDADVFAFSARTGEGLEGLLTLMTPGRTVVVVGPSGAGKSTLTNALGAERELATGEIRDDGKGRHTTTAREMVRLAGGALLIDTPGLRSLELWGADESIAATYDDVTELAAQCRFRNCGHGTEPGCAVNAAVDEGLLDGERIDGYAKLQREEERLGAKLDARLRAEHNKKIRSFSRSIRDQPNR